MDLINLLTWKSTNPFILIPTSVLFLYLVMNLLYSRSHKARTPKQASNDQSVIMASAFMRFILILPLWQYPVLVYLVTGIGLADFTRRLVIRECTRDIVYDDVLTSGYFDISKLGPIRKNLEAIAILIMFEKILILAFCLLCFEFLGQDIWILISKTAYMTILCLALLPASMDVRILTVCKNQKTFLFNGRI